MMALTLFAGSANPSLAEAVAARLGADLGSCAVQRFPDGELHVEVHDSVRGHDVYLIQPVSPPPQEHLLELLLLADACRRAGAAHLTAVVPYLAYARQDRRASGREPVGARLIADLMKAGGLQRVLAVDLHTPALEGFFDVPLEHLSAVPLLAEAVRPWASANDVIVAPDFGAVKLAERYARLLHLPVAIVHKARLSGEEVKALGITGDVRGRAPLIVDDMISTGGTIEAANRALLAADCLPEISLVVSHALLVGSAAERLRDLPLRRCLLTDSVAGATSHLLPLEVVGLGPLLADAIERLHGDRSLSDLIVHA
jgi:ribose-phosphate pyrophosphokinase